MIRDRIKRIPFLGLLTVWVKRNLFERPFPGSEQYWLRRYEAGGNSGSGSFGRLAEFKAGQVNEFVRLNNVSTIIEYGCGDGNQLGLSKYPSYIGFDISSEAISRCSEIFADDPSKSFRLMRDYRGEKAELTLSLDVVYHLVEYSVFERYMARLFDSSERFVIIYSSNWDEHSIILSAHVRHRRFSIWIKQNRPNWKLMQHIPNIYPSSKVHRVGSPADFYIYQNT